MQENEQIFESGDKIKLKPFPEIFKTLDINKKCKITKWPFIETISALEGKVLTVHGVLHDGVVIKVGVYLKILSPFWVEKTNPYPWRKR